MARIKVRRTLREELPGIAVLRDAVAGQLRSIPSSGRILDLDMDVDPNLVHLISHDPTGFFTAVDRDETVGFAATHWREIMPLFHELRVNWVLGICLPALALLLLVNKGYHEFLISLLSLDPEQSPLARIEEALGPNLVIVAMCVFPAIFEEIGFRGLVQQRLVAAAGPLVGFVAASALFVALHFSILSAPYLFLLSLFLCWVRNRAERIYPSIVLHFVHNFAVVFLM